MPPSVGEKKTPKLSVTSDIPAPPSPDTAVPMTEDDIEGLTDINQETVPDSMVEDYMGM